MRKLAILLAVGLLGASVPHVIGRGLPAAEPEAEEGSPAMAAPEPDIAGRRNAVQPDTVTYRTWFAGGTRVVFDHDLHAGWIELDCSECHHAENCRSCHQERRVTALATNSRIALHGVCFRCHEQGATLEECDVCHQPIADPASFGAGVERSVKLDERQYAERLTALSRKEEQDELVIAGESLPFERETPAPPEEHIFLAAREEGVSLVQFPHAAHAEDYGIACAACHHMESCSHCHLSTSAPVEVVGLQEALMNNCIACHEARELPTACEACHQDPHEM